MKSMKRKSIFAIAVKTSLAIGIFYGSVYGSVAFAGETHEVDVFSTRTKNIYDPKDERNIKFYITKNATSNEIINSKKPVELSHSQKIVIDATNRTAETAKGSGYMCSPNTFKTGWLPNLALQDDVRIDVAWLTKEAQFCIFPEVEINESAVSKKLRGYVAAPKALTTLLHCKSDEFNSQNMVGHIVLLNEKNLTKMYFSYAPKSYSFFQLSALFEYGTLLLESSDVSIPKNTYHIDSTFKNFVRLEMVLKKGGYLSSDKVQAEVTSKNAFGIETKETSICVDVLK